MLEGIGYYEMTGKVGVSGASFAGGTEIVIYGQGMSHTPSSLTALFSNDYMGTHQAGPPKPCKDPISVFIYSHIQNNLLLNPYYLHY
jgi:hypothetical protein